MPDDAPVPPTPARDLRLVGVVCAWLFVGLVWSFATPPLEAPDEMVHVDMVRHVVDERGYPRDAITVDGASVSARAWVLRYAEGRRFTEVVQPRAERPTFEDLRTDTTFEAPNQMVQHPPLGYAHLVLAESLLRIAPGERSFDLHLWWLRLASVLLGAAVPLLIARAVRHLGGTATQGVVAALLPLAVPQFGTTLGTIGNDLPLVLAGAGASVALARALGRRADAGARLGAAIGAGALTKGFGLALFVLPAALLLERPRRARAATVALAVGAAVGGWWWAWNLVRFGAVQTHGVPLQDLYGPPLDDGPGVVRWVRQAAPLLVDRFWGAFGSFSLHIGLPRWVTLTATVALAARFALAVRRSGPPVRRFAAATTLLLVGSLAVLAWGALDIYTTYGQLLGVQGRYLFAAVPGLAVVVGLGIQRSDRVAVAASLAAVASLQGLALWEVLGGWWGAPGASTAERLSALAGWSPVPPSLAGILLVLLLAGGAAALTPAPRPAPAGAGGAPPAPPA